jgi:hypothetical protein
MVALLRIYKRANKKKFGSFKLNNINKGKRARC